MENGTPQYAEWLPEAGGYVHNGKVVSTQPVYTGEGAKFETTVDLSRLTGQPTAQQQSNGLAGVSAIAGGAVQAANTLSGNNGISTANIQGSGQDANATMTQANSLNSLSENTANTPYGPINTPATSSIVAGDTTVSPLEQAQKDYQYMVATNNLKGQIDALTKIGQLTNVDYSGTIADLTRQRNQKIMTQDNAYSQQISNAYASGDYQTANDLMAERDAYRNKVGFQDALQSDYEMKQQEAELDYQTTYMQGVTDITNALLQQVSNLINFQYNPAQDRALQIAQGYAVGAVKEQMNHTGMYFSSMTQNAITRAVAELVPVYEKMAKDEIKENISLLQNTAGFLMDLEQTQFNLWKGQLQVKWDANAERRKEYQAALDRANAWGYVSNEDAATLGVAPGTLSPDAMKEARALQQQIDKEMRALQQDKELERYKTDLELSYYSERAKIDEYYKEQYLNYSQRFSTPKVTTNQPTYKYVVDKDGNVTTTITTNTPVGKNQLTSPNGGQNAEQGIEISSSELADRYQKFAEYTQRTPIEEENFLKTVYNGNYSEEDKYVVTQDMINSQVVDKFGSQTTTEAVDSIISFAKVLENIGVDAGVYAEYMGDKLLDQISKKAGKGNNALNSNFENAERQIVFDKLENSGIDSLATYTLDALKVGWGNGIYTYEDGVIKDVTENVKDAAKQRVEGILNKKGRNNI